MSAAQRSRQRRPSAHRDRTPRHVEAVLDPTWQSPYNPSIEERDHNRQAPRASALQRTRSILIVGAVVFAVSVIVGVAGIWVHSLAGWWWPLLGLLVLGAAYGVSEARARSIESAVPALASELDGAFVDGGSSRDALRLSTIVERLRATFGLSDVSVRIVRDEGYNAALLPTSDGLLLLVTSSLMRDFELIEIEGVIAHLMARQRLGALERLTAASQSGLDFARAHELAGASVAYRADEVAAAGIRYPQGLSAALAKCAAQHLPADSFFASPTYAATRWVWFNVYADGPSVLPGDLDEASVRSRALAEW